MSSNEEIIRRQIQLKTDPNMPYYCPSSVFWNVQTDVNEFPYQRFYRGKPDVSHPVVWGREAGYQKIVSSPSFIPRPQAEKGLTNLCFQMPCSTVLPCNPTNASTLKNKEFCVYISP